MIAAKPFRSIKDLLVKAESCWFHTTEKDWIEAFSHHPKIGDLESLEKKYAATASIASGEQGAVKKAPRKTLEELAQKNELYENKFGFIFIVCATGKTAKEMLGLLNERMDNSRETELKIAAAEQQKITQLRLQKLFS